MFSIEPEKAAQTETPAQQGKDIGLHHTRTIQNMSHPQLQSSGPHRVTSPPRPTHRDELNGLQAFDGWLRTSEIRHTLLAAFFGTLTALVLIVLFGGPLALSLLAGPAVGGGGYALWRRVQTTTSHPPQPRPRAEPELEDDTRPRLPREPTELNTPATADPSGDEPDQPTAEKQSDRPK